MGNMLLSGFWRYMLKVPPLLWEKQLAKGAQRMEVVLGFMAEDHHIVRNFVVKELPHEGKPLAPDFIAEKLNLSVDRVKVILDELEENLAFIFRNSAGAVVWAYPVTIATTPHQVTFSTGEQLYAA